MHKGVGYGRVTGIRSYSMMATSALLIDSPELYERIVSAMGEYVGGQYSGYPGFKFTAGSYMDFNLLVGTIPPYPEAVVEAVSELYMMGVRNIAVVSRGLVLGRRSGEPPVKEEDIVFVAIAAVPLDGVATKVAPLGVPLLPSDVMLRYFLNVISERAIESRGSESMEIGRKLKVMKSITVTLRSPRMPWSYSEVEQYLGMRGVKLVDSVTAPLYALQYYYGKLKTLSLIVAVRSLIPSFLACS